MLIQKQLILLFLFLEVNINLKPYDVRRLLCLIFNVA